MAIMDANMAGVAAFSVSASNVSLSYSNVQQCEFRFGGTLLANIVVSPAVGDATTYFNGFYLFNNLTLGSFTITLQNGFGSVVLPQGRAGIVFVSTTNSLAPHIVAIAGGSTADPIPAGSRTLWYNPSAPSGWTAVVLNDYAIKVVSNGSGGVTSGSVAYSTLYARTATDNHALTTDEIPSHRHFTVVDTTVVPASSPLTAANSIARVGDTGDTARYNLGGSASTPTLGLTSLTGSGFSHSHNIDMRVLTAAFVLATRD